MKAVDFFKEEEGQNYLAKFQGETFVVKYGGAALEEKETMHYFLEDVAEMKKNGINIILVHGGGKMLSRKMQEKNLPVIFENGLRKTTPEVAEIAKEAFAELNAMICEQLEQYGCKTLSLVHGRAVKARLMNPQDPQNRVGEVVSIEAGLIDIHTLPVISSVGQFFGQNGSADNESGLMKEDEIIPYGSVLNINADLLAVNVAESVKAKKLIFISDVNGIYLDHLRPETKLSHVTESEIMQLIEKGILHGGMKLKVEMALSALKSGVNKVHFIDGSIEHSLMYEIFTEKGIGTEIVHES